MENDITVEGKSICVERSDELHILVITSGQLFTCQWGVTQVKTLKIMAVADDYVMARYKGCMPFVKHKNEFGRFLESVKAKLLK